jgi:hypothetical protein
MAEQNQKTMPKQSPAGAYYAACEAFHSAVLAIQAAEARRDAAMREMERLEKEMNHANTRTGTAKIGMVIFPAPSSPTGGGPIHD